MKEVVSINPLNLAALLGIHDLPLTVILGKPHKDAKGIKAKKFAKRVQMGKQRANCPV